jgi:hypothetical protein
VTRLVQKFAEIDTNVCILDGKEVIVQAMYEALPFLSPPATRTR